MTDDDHPFRVSLESFRASVTAFSDQELAEMEPPARELILSNRAALAAYDRGDCEELERLALEQLDKLRETLRRFM